MKTHDYSIFKTIEGNRRIVPGHVQRLSAAIEKKNLLEYFPILVNENMEIIDGQHRLMAGARNGTAVYYEIVPGLRLEDVMSINTNSRNWSVKNFVETYITLGNEDYIRLNEFCTKYGLSYTMGAGLLLGYASFKTGGSLAKKIKTGEFTINTPATAMLVAEHVVELNSFADFDTTKDRELAYCLWSLVKSDDYRADRLIAKLRQSGQKLTKRPSAQYYALQIEDIYNFKAKNKVDLYSTVKR